MRDPLRLRRLSIRARTTLTATGIVALATVAIGLSLIGYLHGRLTEELDAALNEQLSTAREAVLAGVELPVRMDDVTVRAIPAGAESALPIPEPGEAPAPGPPMSPLAPADPEPGEPVSPQDDPRPRPVEPLGPPATGVRSDLPGGISHSGEEPIAPLRTAQATVDTPAGAQTLIASASTRSVQRATEAATTGLLFGMPVLLAVVAALTWFSTRRALRPVEAIRHEFTRLSAHDLRGRMPVPASGDEIARLALTLNDTLDRLDDSVRRQRQFVADASHELRSPLAALRTPLEVAQAHPQRADWPGIAEGTLDDLDRLERLTSDLLALARIDGMPHTAGEALDLGSLAADTLERRPPTHVRRHAEIEPGVVVDGHRTHLSRLITNLLDNAETHAEQRVSLSLRVEDGRARLDVLDDGPGVPAESREHVFERFARLDTARARERGGAGLGLALAREIAQLHDGTLAITDSDRGARFTATFPLAQP
ncbi:sensor histidine kinase [Saccharopolyspora gregorii]|uniref:sensor histidine kinase n=1 Tax=Saccharopolyspora gregorii TaxID=33914 RepID=UPI0021AC7A2C|nr:ATP-binding protein [Saccharopolyspora gregorii]